MFLNYIVTHIKITRIKLKSDTEVSIWLLNLGWALAGRLQMISLGHLLPPSYCVLCFQEVTVSFLVILEPEQSIILDICKKYSSLGCQPIGTWIFRAFDRLILSEPVSKWQGLVLNQNHIILGKLSVSPALAQLDGLVLVCHLPFKEHWEDIDLRNKYHWEKEFENSLVRKKDNIRKAGGHYMSGQHSLPWASCFPIWRMK